MVVGLWEFVKFLWSHPIISCLVLLLFSPPFFPIIVYFSPVLLCTGLVAIAMVSMSVGESAQSEDWRNGTGRLHEPGLHHSVEMPVKPARESWVEWMKKKEEKAKAWVDSRFLNQDKWHLLDKSVLVSEEEPDLVTDNEEIDVGYRIPRYEAPTPVIANRGHIHSPLEANRDVDPPLAQASSVPAAENIKPIFRAQASVGDRTTAFSNVSDPTLDVPLAAVAEEEVVKGKSEAPSPLKEQVYNASKGRIPIRVPTAEGLPEEQPVFKSKSEPRASDDGVIEGVSESFSMDLEKRAQERRAEPWESIAAFEDSRAFVVHSDEGNTVGELIAGNWKGRGGLGIPVGSVEAVQKVVDGEARNFETSAHMHGKRLASVEVLVSPEYSVSGEERKASPESQGDFDQQDVVNQPTQRFTATEKIIFVDEPSKSRRDHSRSMVAETTGQMEALAFQKEIGQIIKVETKLHEANDVTDEDSKGPQDGLDENIESHRNFLPLSTTSAAVLVQRNPDAMALVKSQTISEEEILPESCKALVPSTPHHLNDLENLAEQMEPTMALISNDPAAHVTSFGGSVLEKSFSSNSTFKGEREEYDDLTLRFNALKKSMSLHTTRRWEEPIPSSLRTTANAIVPVYIPSLVSGFQTEQQLLESSVVFAEKKKPLPQPRLSSEDVESLESLTARLQKKFTLNLRKELPITSPPSRPVPALPSIAAVPISVESDKNVEIEDSDKSGEITGSLVLPIHSDPAKSKLKNSRSKKALTFLSRRRERLLSSQLVDPFSIADEGGKGGSKLASGATADTVASSAEIVADNRDEGSTTSGRQLKERMISPLKRVFSMDANEGSSRKVEVGEVPTVKSSPAKEKQSVIDRSKVKMKKLFSTEGGLMNVEAGSDTISLKKSKSISQKSIDKNEELTEDRDGVVENAVTNPKLTPSLVPSEVVHGVENEDVNLERQEELPISPKLAPSLVPSEVVHGVENEDVNLERQQELPTSPKLAPSLVPSDVVHGVEHEDVKLERQEELPSIAAETPSAAAVEDLDRDPRITKSSGDKKFMWSWRNSQKSVSRKIGEQNLVLVGEQIEPGHTTPSLVTSEVVHGVENEDVKSERREELPSIAAETPPAQTVEGSDLDPRITKSSGDKKFMWSWRNSQKSAARKLGEQNVELVRELTRLGQTAMPMPKTPELAASSSPTEVDGNAELAGEQKEVGQTTLESAAPSSPTEVVHGIVENVDVESEKQELPGIDAAVALFETAEGLDNVLKPVLSSPTSLPSTPEKKEPGHSTKPIGKEVLKSSSEKKFGWTWKKKKQFSEPVDDTQPMMDQSRSQDAISLSGKGVLEAGHVIVKVDGKTEGRELPSIDEAAEPPAETKETMQPLRGPEDAAEERRSRVTKPSSEKKFEWSWTKKKRSSEPADDAPAVVDQFRSQDDSAFPVSRTGMLDESREIMMSPLSRFHSASAIMSPVHENAHVDVPVPWDENLSSEFTFSPRPDANSSHRGSPKANSSPFKTSSVSWLSPKTDPSKTEDPVEEKGIPAEKKKKGSWWPRRHRRADSEAVSSSSANISSPTGDSANAIPCERSGPLSPFSTGDNTNNIHDFVVGNSNRLHHNDPILEGDDELLEEMPPRRARHRRERSDSLPTISNGAKFSRLHGRQASLSEITLPRTPELSPGSSYGRATDSRSSVAAMRSGTWFSRPRTEEEQHPEHVKRSSDGNGAKSSTTSVSTTPLSTSSYQRHSAVRMLDLANQQLKGGSPFHRSDLDVSGSRGGLYRSSPSAAEIRITDKLKAPLEEILSLLAIGESDQQHRHTTVDSNRTGGAASSSDCLQQAASSSSSSENETSSEEEWSAKSDNEDELQEQQQEQQQFALLPPSGRIRRRLPPYVFCREEEPTAN